jgi:hypothetical protein
MTFGQFVVLACFNHGTEVLRFDSGRDAAAASHDEPSVITHLIDEPLAVSFDILRLGNREHGRGNIAMKT